MYRWLLRYGKEQRGVDIAMNCKDEKNVHMGGLVGIALATIFSTGLALLIVAGYYGGGNVPEEFAGNLNPVSLMKGGILSPGFANILMILLAISSFPAACFSSLIAANSFKDDPAQNQSIGLRRHRVRRVVRASLLLADGPEMRPACLD